jgi:aldehyde dehydrogenase (NAD+)
MVTPWNSPLLLLAWKLAPALAAGNTAVVKPSEFTSASTLEFMDLFHQAGFPPGVVNTVTGLGSEAGVPLVSHPAIAKIAFTGSDTSGQKIYETAAKGIKPVSLELGGKSPNIVFGDSDLEAAAIGVVSGFLSASGQTCVAGSRLLLQRSIYDRFLDKLLALVQQVRIGDPMDARTNVGPITTRPQYEKILHYIELGKSEGARCLFGGKPVTGPLGNGSQLIEPTIFADVHNDMKIAREEIFGPVLSIIQFESEQEALDIANDSAFGLAAGIWTKDFARAIRMAERLQAGTVWVNTYRTVSFTSPFGGYKRSGIGRESGHDAMMEYLQIKSIWMATNSEVQNPFVLR